jgi:hypothetical protein
MNRFLAIVFAAAVTVSSAATADAQSFPDHPIKVVVPLMGRRAGFHANQARRQRPEELQHLAAPQLLANDDLLCRVNAVDLEHVLGDIQTNCGNLHGTLPDVIR